MTQDQVNRFTAELERKLQHMPIKRSGSTIEVRYKCDPDCPRCKGSGYVTYERQEVTIYQTIETVQRTGVCPRLQPPAPTQADIKPGKELPDYLHE